MAGRERLGAAAAGEPQVARGDLGVEAVLRAAGRVAVGEPDEGVGRRGDRALDRHAAAGGRETPAEVLEAAARAERLPEGVERQLVAVVADNDGGEEGRPERTEPQARGAELEEGPRTLIEPRHLAPGVVVGVAAPPVVVLAADPVGHRDRAAVDRERTAIARERQADERLGARHGGFV